MSELRKTPWSDQKMNPLDVQEKLNAFVSIVQRLQDDYFALNGFTFSPSDHVTVSYGKRYARIIKQKRYWNDAGEAAIRTGDQKSVHCFVDMNNGDILKGSWKAPVKNGVRGNIFTDDPAESIDNHGTKYL
tara:strand:- start:391 stop:783 length:393 start_codon:yes stop_codon:yes gene_type:complete